MVIRNIQFEKFNRKVEDGSGKGKKREPIRTRELDRSSEKIRRALLEKGEGSLAADENYRVD